MRKSEQKNRLPHQGGVEPPRDTPAFASGIIYDGPASELPATALADGWNIVVYPTYLVGRTGSRLFKKYLPSIPDRTGYSATKTGNIITATTPIFTIEDVSNYFVWPTDPETHEEIEEFISTTQVRVAESGDIPLLIGCRIRGKNNGWKFHEITKKWMFQLYKQFYILGTLMQKWNEVLCVSRDLPNNAISDWQSIDKYSCLWINSNGNFHIEIQDQIGYKINCPVPNIKPDSVLEGDLPGSDLHTHENLIHPAYKLTYSAARLAGDWTLRHRLSPSRIETETGTIAIDNEGKDYAEVWSYDPIGPGTAYYQRIIGGDVSDEYLDPMAWLEIPYYFGDATTQFDISNPGGDIHRYTYDGTGTAPLFVTNGLRVGQTIVINSPNFAAGNDGQFEVVRVAETYFEVSNAAGAVEVNRTLGTATALARVCSNGGFDIALYGETHQIICSFAGITSLVDVAARIQIALREHEALATCTFDGDTFIMTAGRTDGSTISFASASTVGTIPDISTIMAATAASGATRDTYPVNRPKIVGPFWVPVVPNTLPQEYQWHYTHFPYYRTLDINALNALDSSKRANNPERFVWVNDIRICASFYGYRAGGYYTASYGVFEGGDVGSTLEYDNGWRDTILEVVNDHTIRYAGGPRDDYYEGPPLWLAAEIGNGRVMRASQSNDIVTITPTDNNETILPTDLRKTIHWPNGERSYVKEFINSYRFRVYDSTDRDLQGFTMDPTYRHWNDATPDTVLDDRLSKLLLRQRFWEAMPNCNLGVISPGFFISARRYEGKLYYCQINPKYIHLLGFHNPAEQIDETIPNDIQALYLFKDVFVAWTSRQTWGGPVSVPNIVKLPKVGEIISLLPGVELIDGDIGCFDVGSIQAIGDGMVALYTSEPGSVGFRRFNGFKYGANEAVIAELGQGRFETVIENTQNASASIYDGFMGYLRWGRQK